MKVSIKIVIIISTALLLVHCNSKKHDAFKAKKVYQTKDLIITQIAENSFVHTSYKQTHDFGNVTCNGLIVSNSNEAIIFDTPTTDKPSYELIHWIKETLHCKINAIIPTHFHDDCLGGLKAFDDNAIPSYGYYKTILLAKENHFAFPKNSFKDSLTLKVGHEKVMVKFFGEGHTKDNVVGYFPSEKILFGGCLVKEVNANKGYLGDANLDEWSNTVAKVKKEYADVALVVPGHGAYGNQKLLDYTITLFQTK
ncbi:subclass B1 metallo-beta-lactamase [Flavobacterium paronense]|uniref:beta-lactamase n=1 Tax=Flavobacterium paronense TaxID=1392775 RepID=A0ABV5GH85_9FLAO|nr:subclass B1 metallo-beta-lactamase [Flavobacterium paronense]MDN3676527.1 subclass B1 metallo-beta-lactamase [Flavobacterium paronense]